jgi:phosphoribosylformimino-5-aminoimidazole carboxamide ribotide isomerase
MGTFTLYPALDLRGGRVVRLDQGDYARETRYADDALALAREYAAHGARWLHVVDLDAARFGRFMHLDLVASLALDSGLSVQAGGGVRNADDIEQLLDAGVARVVIGSVAVKQPDLAAAWIADYGSERICVALDTRMDADGTCRLPVKGWTEDTGLTLFDLVERLRAASPLRHVLCTDIARDGMLVGPNVALYRELAERHPGLAVQASGGVRDAADVKAVRAAGARGVVVGKALLEQRVTVRELVACPAGPAC